MQHLRPISTVSAAADWTASTTTLHGDTDEGLDSPDDDATYASVNVFGADMELQLAPGLDPGTNASHVLIWRARRAGVHFTDAEVDVRLYEGAVLRASATHSMHSNRYSTASYTLTDAEAASIVDYTDLRVRVQLVADITTARLRLTAIEFNTPSVAVMADKRGALVSPEAMGQVVAPKDRGEVREADSSGQLVAVESKGEVLLTGSVAALLDAQG